MITAPIAMYGKCRIQKSIFAPKINDNKGLWGHKNQHPEWVQFAGHPSNFAVTCMSANKHSTECRNQPLIQVISLTAFFTNTLTLFVVETGAWSKGYELWFCPWQGLGFKIQYTALSMTCLQLHIPFAVAILIPLLSVYIWFWYATTKDKWSFQSILIGSQNCLSGLTGGVGGLKFCKVGLKTISIAHLYFFKSKYLSNFCGKE